MELTEREQAFNRFADWWLSANEGAVDADRDMLRAVLAAGWGAGIEWLEKQRE